MKIYRKVIPKIAKDSLRALLASQAIDVEDGKRDEAELDLAGVIVRYLNDVDRVSNDATEAIQRHELDISQLSQVKVSIAKTRKVPLGSEALEHVLTGMVGALYDSRYIEEIYLEDHEVQKIIQDAMGKYLGVDAELDREVRGRLKNLREGTSEWELEYNRLIDQIRTH